MERRIKSQQFPGCFYSYVYTEVRDRAGKKIPAGDFLGEGGQAEVYKVLLKEEVEEKIIIKGLYAVKVIPKAKLKSKEEGKT